MKVYTVFVKDDMGHRFIDTSWAILTRAHKRRDQLKETMAAMNFKGEVWIVPMEVEDVEIKGK